jgi:hypothetical protein
MAAASIQVMTLKLLKYLCPVPVPSIVVRFPVQPLTIQIFTNYNRLTTFVIHSEESPSYTKPASG